MRATGEDLLKLLGLAVEEPPVQEALEQLARGMQPELDPEDEDKLVDWVTVNEIGLEFGFEDEAFVKALDPAMRREGPLLLSQLYFYGDTPKTQPFPHPLPFGLSFNDDRAAARQKMGTYENTRRSYLRDAWKLPKFDVTIAYRSGGNLESVFCHLPYEPWPPASGEAELVAPFTPEVFVGLFGRRWSNPDMRARLAPVGYHDQLSEVRAEHMADLRNEHGLELSFAPSKQLATADQAMPKALALAAVTFYASRELDAREWKGPLPFGIRFADTQDELRAKIPEKPAQWEDDILSGLGVWHFERFSLTVLYSNLENRVLRVTLMAPGYFDSTA